MIYYYVPDHDEASWGIGMLYQHVSILNRNGYQATVLHGKKPGQIDWLSIDVPAISLNSASFKPASDDILVVPEVCAGDPELHQIPCRRLVFVQGSFLILPKLRGSEDYGTLGFEHALVILPHMKTIVENHFGVSASVIPPFIAPYFFLEQNEHINESRARRVIIYPKTGYIKAGLPDYDIVSRFLSHRMMRQKGTVPRWELQVLKNKSHRETAQLMQTSSFFINVNSMEGFNTTVPEAMAAGCIPVCYDAFGGSDFLRDGHNAHVFPNHYAYPLLDKIFELMDRYDEMQKENLQMQKHAFNTAGQYTVEHTEMALLSFYRSFAVKR